MAFTYDMDLYYRDHFQGNRCTRKQFRRTARTFLLPDLKYESELYFSKRVRIVLLFYNEPQCFTWNDGSPIRVHRKEPYIAKKVKDACVYIAGKVNTYGIGSIIPHLVKFGYHDEALLLTKGRRVLVNCDTLQRYPYVKNPSFRTLFRACFYRFKINFERKWTINPYVISYVYFYYKRILNLFPDDVSTLIINYTIEIKQDIGVLHKLYDRYRL